MIKLYVFQRCWGLINPSPFCMKLEVYLKLAKIPYEAHITNIPDKSPSGKLPFIKDGSKTISDTTEIIKYLKETYGNPLDQNVTPLQQARAVMAQRLVEEHLYFAMVYSRWIDDTYWPKTFAEFFKGMPKILQMVIPKVVRKKVRKQLWYQGIGRLTGEQIYAAGKQDINALAELLGEQKFYLGDTLTSIDATIYSFLASILDTPIDSPLQDCIKQNANVVSYCERIKNLLTQ